MRNICIQVICIDKDTSKDHIQGMIMLTASKIAIYSKRLFFYEKVQKKGVSEDILERKRLIGSESLSDIRRQILAEKNLSELQVSEINHRHD